MLMFIDPALISKKRSYGMLIPIVMYQFTISRHNLIISSHANS